MHVDHSGLHTTPSGKSANTVVSERPNFLIQIALQQRFVLVMQAEMIFFATACVTKSCGSHLRTVFGV